MQYKILMRGAEENEVLEMWVSEGSKLIKFDQLIKDWKRLTQVTKK